MHNAHGIFYVDKHRYTGPGLCIKLTDLADMLQDMSAKVLLKASIFNWLPGRALLKLHHCA